MDCCVVLEEEGEEGPSIQAIWMDEEDAEKMVFIMPWGMYCYKIMPFCLKNAQATYMRAMTTIFHDMIHKEIEVPPNELNATSSLWPFAAWGMDVRGPIEPAASNGYRFILVAIDYFTKWVEVASCKAVTKKVVADFVRDRILCRFEILESIITDNGSNPNSDLMKAMIIEEAELDDAERVKSRFEQLALKDGKRMNAVCHGQLYQNRMSRAFNKRVKPRQFTPGQLVLKKLFYIRMKAKGNSLPTSRVHTWFTGF
ncbi:uncharacterized protein [Nicotiana sylvestris]|uniref:uncharacterized protein n=1 Tax=Nicotiana sylvestris TaxID=4096 RepID=UPI00388CCDE3